MAPRTGDYSAHNVMTPMETPHLAVPDDYRLGWCFSFDLSQDSIDELGHVAAVDYPSLFDRATDDLFAGLLATPLPDYVAAYYCLRFRHEITMDQAPVHAYSLVDAVTDSTIDLTQVLEDDSGLPCTVAQYRWVAWDRGLRRGRKFTTAERNALSRQLHQQRPPTH